MDPYKYKFYNNPSVDPVTDEPIKIGSPRFHELAKEYGYPKIKSPKSHRLIDVGKGTYSKLIPEYTHEYLLSQRNLVPMNIQTSIVPNVTLTKDFIPNLPDDVTIEIIKNMTTYNQLQFCNSNKQIHKLCKEINGTMEILKYNLQPKTMAVTYERIIIIKNNEIYQISITDIIKNNTKMDKLILPLNVIPISIVSEHSKVIVSTNDGLYFLNITLKNKTFTKMTSPPGTILYISYYSYFSVITTEGVYYVKDAITVKKLNTLKYTNIPVDSTPYMIITKYDSIMIATEKGLYTQIDKQFNYLDIEGNDILGFNDDLIITTSGIYSLYLHVKISKISIAKIPHLKTIYQYAHKNYYIFHDDKIDVYQPSYDNEMRNAFSPVVDVVFGRYSVMKSASTDYYVFYIDNNELKNILLTF